MKTTKTIILAVVLVVGTLFTSCSKDDETPAIVGVWLETAGTSERFINGDSQGATENVIDENNYEKITINANGTFSIVYYEDGVEGNEETGTYTVDGNETSFIFTGETLPDPDESYVLTNGVLTYTFTEEYTDGIDDFMSVFTATYTKQ